VRFTPWVKSNSITKLQFKQEIFYNDSRFFASLEELNPILAA